VRNITAKDIKDRKLEKNLKGVVITNISSKSPVAGMLREGDIITEVQKNKVLNSKQLNQLIESIYKKGEQTLLLTIINNNNRRRYLGVKTN
jgi:PDZ domain-containing secreted protein